MAPEPVDLEILLDGWGRRSGPQPVRMGIPLPKGRCREPGGLALSENGSPAPCDIEATARWSDGSLKWVLLRFLARAGADGGPRAYRLIGAPAASKAGAGVPDGSGSKTLALRNVDGTLEVDTGVVLFTLDGQWLYPLRQARRDGVSLLGHAGVPVLLEDSRGRPHRFRIASMDVEYAGSLHAEILVEGDLVDAGGAPFCKGECRLFFYAGTALVRIEFALWNPRPARHVSGLWDLGDPGSVFFRSCRLPFPPASGAAGGFAAGLEPGDGECLDGKAGPLSVHQSGSGNDSWRSLAHVDRHNKPTPLFQGYRLTIGEEAREGRRANPALIFADRSSGRATGSGPVAGEGPALAMAMEKFWQTFPNRLSAGPDGLVAEPFPAGEAEFELQGGEMAPCAVWLDFASSADPSEALACARIPVTPRLEPGDYAASGCFPYLSQAPLGTDPFWNDLGRDFLAGGNSIFARRERFEEFGWRNFGEFPADHEKEHYSGTRAFVSHYNNQYDLIQSCLLQFAGGGDARWFALATDLGIHVMHVDLYRTSGDKPAYNGGYFWHTAHYAHAGTATHRCYSRQAYEPGPPPPGFGGGPSNEHNYTTGLLLYHYLTGDRRAARCVRQLAGWVEGMQDGSRTAFRFLSANPTGLATATRELAYQGPGRGAGNSINACLDAAALTGDRAWIDRAEGCLRTCLGPGDDPAALELADRERRWSYVVFLQSVGKFLDVKAERGEFDGGFHHGRACLLKLADWMAANEYPYLDRPGDLEFPTSTWAAQDIRKGCVFLFAAKYGPASREAEFRDHAARFLAAAKRYLGGYPDRDSVRNMALMLITVPMHGFAARTRSLNLGLEMVQVPAVPGHRPVPQKIEAMARAKRIIATLGLAAIPILLKLIAQRRSAARNRRLRP